MLNDLIEDVLLEILSKLDRPTLGSVLRTCRELAQFSHHTRLWQMKLVRQYGPEYLLDQQPTETYREMYLNLQKSVFQWSWKAIRAGHLYVLRALTDGKKKTYSTVPMTLHPGMEIPKDAWIRSDQLNAQARGKSFLVHVHPPIQCTVSSANNAARWGHLHILNWLELQGLLPNEDGADYAAEAGHLSVLIWLQSRGISATIHGFQRACFQGHLDLLKWMIDEDDFQPDLVSARMAARGGHLQVLQWLHELRVPLTNCLYGALRGNHVEMVQWLIEQGRYPLQRDMNQLCLNDHPEMLSLLEKRELWPDRNGATRAFKLGHHRVSEWLADRGILPDPYTPPCLKPGHFDLLQKLVAKGFRPSQDRIDRYYQRCIKHRQKVEFGQLLATKLLPSNEVLWSALAMNRFEYLDHLVEHGCPPVEGEWTSLDGLIWKHAHGFDFDQRDILIAAKLDDLKAIQWIYTKGYLASRATIGRLVEMDRAEILAWMHQQHFIHVDAKLANTAYHGRRRKILAWLGSLKIYPTR